MSIILSFLNSLKNLDHFEIDFPSSYQGTNIVHYKTLDTTRYQVYPHREKYVFVSHSNNGITQIGIPPGIDENNFLREARNYNKKIFFKKLKVQIRKYRAVSARDDNPDRDIITLIRTYLSRDRVDTYINEYLQLVQIACLKVQNLKF